MLRGRILSVAVLLVIGGACSTDGAARVATGSSVSAPSESSTTNPADTARSQASRLSAAIRSFHIFDIADFFSGDLDYVRKDADELVLGHVASARFGEPIHDTMVEACEKAEGVPSGGTCDVTNTTEFVVLEVKVERSVALRHDEALQPNDTIQVSLAVGPANAEFEHRENAKAVADVRRSLPSAPALMYLSRETDGWQLANVFALALVGPNGELYSGPARRGSAAPRTPPKCRTYDAMLLTDC